MDQRQLVKLLEEHFRNEERAKLDYRKRIHEERESQTDEEWWDELIERTTRIRPKMLEIFLRNKAEMIAKRFHTISSEEAFREKTIQKRVMELLPFVSSVRAEMSESEEFTAEHIQLALSRKLAKEMDTGRAKSGVFDLIVEPDGPADPSNLIDSLIELQLKRQEKLN